MKQEVKALVLPWEMRIRTGTTRARKATERRRGKERDARHHKTLVHRDLYINSGYPLATPHHYTDYCPRCSCKQDFPADHRLLLSLQNFRSAYRVSPPLHLHDVSRCGSQAARASKFCSSVSFVRFICVCDSFTA